MTDILKKGIIKSITIDTDKCTGCRACEMACSAIHASPKYSNLNPARSRIRVFMDEVNDQYVPVRAGDYTPAECACRNEYILHGKKYEACTFCKASCPSRDFFKEPGSGFPIRCDMCESEPSLEEPMCVQVCPYGALTYESRMGEREEIEAPGVLDRSLELLADRYGFHKIMNTVARLSANG